MKDNEKRVILILVIVAVIVIAGVLIWKNASSKKEEPQKPEANNNTIAEKYVDILADGTKLNKSNKLKETKKLDGYEITNVQLTYANGQAVFLADVKNTTSTDMNVTPVEITLYDDQHKKLRKLTGMISPAKAGETVQLNTGISSDYANAYEYSIVKK